MGANLDLLIPEFRVKVDAVLAECKARGYELRPFFTLRSVAEQAQLWRQSRTSEQIIVASTRVKAKGAPKIAAAILAQKPTHGPWVTNALPGQSWHQFGEAVDCFVVMDGKAVWDAQHPGYVNYSLVAQDHGLTAGRYWKGAPDPPHVQYRAISSPLHIMTWSEIEAKLFGASNGGT